MTSKVEDLSARVANIIRSLVSVSPEATHKYLFDADYHAAIFLAANLYVTVEDLRAEIGRLEDSNL